MSESLRMRVVEAGARALAVAICDEDETYDEGCMADHRAEAEAALDAVLDCLTENADEWEQGAAHKLAEPVQESAFVAELLDLLRPHPSP